jgi:uncharacterized protein YabN with tetrapyrrole methylase and pyrophosphatase domain
MKIPKGLSSLKQAYLLTEEASKVGFDWEDIDGILKKFEEEIIEFKMALDTKKKVKISEELGDLFFILVNIARFLHIDPERALGRTIRKFILRFNYIEKSLKKSGKTPSQSNLWEMDKLWEEAKRKSKLGIQRH